MKNPNNVCLLDSRTDEKVRMATRERLESLGFTVQLHSWVPETGFLIIISADVIHLRKHEAAYLNEFGDKQGLPVLLVEPHGVESMLRLLSVGRIREELLGVSDAPDLAGNLQIPPEEAAAIHRRAVNLLQPCATIELEPVFGEWHPPLSRGGFHSFDTIE